MTKTKYYAVSLITRLSCLFILVFEDFIIEQVDVVIAILPVLVLISL